MRVMTFNVRGSFHDDGDNDWDKREAFNIATIKKWNPDIIGFQEAQEGNLSSYENELTDYTFELGLLSIRDAENCHRVPIFWKSERFTKVDAGGYYLGDDSTAFEAGWDATYPRAVTWVVLCENDTETDFVVINTHFPHARDVDATRRKCAELIIEHLRGSFSNLPQLVMADFNALPKSPAYQAFMDAGYIDSYHASPYNSDLSTFHGFQGENFEHDGLRIDWILGYDSEGRISITDCRVIMDAEPPIYPSDHYPILIEMEIE
ncbi:MAG: endonuclease/exonuclease/phosphatase family protein [Chloroflexota bacterium]